MRTKALAFSLVLGATLALAPRTASADDAVVVLGITSLEGDDELARNLTGALRHAASTQVHGWQVSDSEVTLAQMSLAHGCSDEPDVECLAQIASALSAQRIVYGLLRRTGGNFSVSLSVYDATTNTIDRTITQEISGRRTDIDDLRDPARTLIGQISGPVTGALRIASSVPNASVSIDGEVAGTTAADGGFSSAAVPVGEHQIAVTATGYEPWTGTVTIARGTEMTLDAELVAGATTPPPGGGGGGGYISWPGIALLGVGAASLGVAIYTWVRIQSIQTDPDYEAYRQGWAPPAPTNICDLASMGTPHGGGTLDMQMARASRVGDLCSEASTMEILQYVFLGVAVAAGATGIVLLVVDTGPGNADEEAALTITPSFGEGHGFVSARLRF